MNESLIRDIGASLVRLGAVDRAGWLRVVEHIDSHAEGTPKRVGAVMGAVLVLRISLAVHKTLTPEQMQAARQRARMEVC